MPSAKATCAGVKHWVMNSTKSNRGRTHDYDRLATKAFLRGELKNYHAAIASKVARRIEDAAAKRGFFKGDHYPKICLNRTFLGTLLQIEMDQERTYFPDRYESRGGDAALRQEFEHAARHKLCSMDDEKILASGLFDPIFKQLNGLS